MLVYQASDKNNQKNKANELCNVKLLNCQYNYADLQLQVKDILLQTCFFILIITLFYICYQQNTDMNVGLKWFKLLYNHS